MKRKKSIGEKIYIQTMITKIWISFFSIFGIMYPIVKREEFLFLRNSVSKLREHTVISKAYYCKLTVMIDPNCVVLVLCGWLDHWVMAASLEWSWEHRDWY